MKYMDLSLADTYSMAACFEEVGCIRCCWSVHRQRRAAQLRLCVHVCTMRKQEFYGLKRADIRGHV